MLASRLHGEESFRLRRLRTIAARPGDSRHRPANEVRRAARMVESPEEEFGRMVIGRIAAGVLRYSDRQALLAVAQRMGIGRFDANLLIAMAQHRHERKVGCITEQSRRWPLLAMAVILQSLILSGFYWLLR